MVEVRTGNLELHSRRPPRPPGTVREPSRGYDLDILKVDEEVEEPGWQFSDPASWDEEQLLRVVDYYDRVFRAHLTSLDEAGVRQLKVTALRQVIRAAREKGHPLPDFSYRVLHELESGER